MNTTRKYPTESFVCTWMEGSSKKNSKRFLQGKVSILYSTILKIR